MCEIIFNKNCKIFATEFMNILTTFHEYLSTRNKKQISKILIGPISYQESRETGFCQLRLFRKPFKLPGFKANQALNFFG